MAKRFHSGYGSHAPLCGQVGGRVITEAELKEGKRVDCKKCLSAFAAMAEIRDRLREARRKP